LALDPKQIAEEQGAQSAEDGSERDDDLPAAQTVILI
jgi:hypothetical protein